MRGGRDPPDAARGRGERRFAVPAHAGRQGFGHGRRPDLDQCRGYTGPSPWDDAGSGARDRGRAGERRRVLRARAPEEGQPRLRPQASADRLGRHAGHHHRGHLATRSGNRRTARRVGRSRRHCPGTPTADALRTAGRRRARGVRSPAAALPRCGAGLSARRAQPAGKRARLVRVDRTGRTRWRHRRTRYPGRDGFRNRDGARTAGRRGYRRQREPGRKLLALARKHLTGGTCDRARDAARHLRPGVAHGRIRRDGFAADRDALSRHSGCGFRASWRRQYPLSCSRARGRRCGRMGRARRQGHQRFRP